jgi:hypothetical protein
MEDMVLVGFGSYKLKDLVGMIGSPEGEKELIEISFEKHLPPVYRRESICSQEDKLAFLEYTGWLIEMTKEKEDGKLQ